MIKNLRVAGIEIEHGTAELKAEAGEQPLHRDIGLIGRREDIRPGKLRACRGDERSSDTTSPQGRVNVDHFNEGAAEEVKGKQQISCDLLRLRINRNQRM